MKIKLTTDSTCDLTPELIKRYEIAEAMPLPISLGDRTLTDGAFDTREIYTHVEKTKQLPKTSAINVFDFEEMFAKHTADGSAVLHFSISSGVSACCQNAQKAATGFKNVYVIDTKQLSTGTSLLIFYAYDLLKNNPQMTVQEAAGIMDIMTGKVQTSFCVDTITYLYKGGRCSALALLGSNLLKIHPSLHLKGGLIKVGKKYRGPMPSVITRYIDDLKAENPEYDDARCFITYTPETDPETVEAAKARTKQIFKFKEILETTAGSTITSHCGKGTLGLLFLNK